MLTPNSNEAIRKIALNEGTIWIPPIQKQRKITGLIDLIEEKEIERSSTVLLRA